MAHPRLYMACIHSPPPNPTSDETLSQTHSSSNDTLSDELTFLLFPRLPRELRDQIWRESIDTKRLITLEAVRYKMCNCAEVWKDVEFTTDFVKNISCRVNHLVPGVRAVDGNPAGLFVCHDSRAIYLRYYEPAFGQPGVHPPIWINFEHDVLYFDQNIRDLVLDRKVNLRTSLGKDSRRINSLAIYDYYQAQDDQFQYCLIHDCSVIGHIFASTIGVLKTMFLISDYGDIPNDSTIGIMPFEDIARHIKFYKRPYHPARDTALGLLKSANDTKRLNLTNNLVVWARRLAEGMVRGDERQSTQVVASRLLKGKNSTIGRFLKAKVRYEREKAISYLECFDEMAMSGDIEDE